MKTIPIHYDGKKIYDICLDHTYNNLLEKLREIGVEGRKVCIITDSNVAPLYLRTVEKIVSEVASKVVYHIFPAGEENKNLDIIEGIYETLIVNKFDRKDYIVALGGGVTGDMSGYAAATFLRGISFIQLPTTLLSQVDSSIGGKTGVDFKQYKNMVGAFHQPSLVYMNLSTLNTLDDRQLSAGMAEVIKHGLIRDDAYYAWIKANAEAVMKRDYDALEYMIEISCHIKGGVVERDPKEQGERALLNYGHTIGHAVEKLKDFTMLHGECVAIGCAAAACLSCKKGLISEADYADVCETLKAYKLPVKATALDAADILNTTKSDKKMDAGKVKFILLNRIGDAFIDRNLSDDEILFGCQSVLE